MIVIFNTNGSICDAEMADYVQQGSVGVNKVQLAFADSSRDGLSAYLIAQRPNGTSVTLPAHMASFLCNGERYEGWEVTLGGSFTLYAGVVHCTLNVVDGDNQIQANYPFDVTVNATGNPITGDWDEQINVAQYNSYMAQLSDKAAIKRQASFTGPGQPNVLYLIGSNPYEAYVWDPVEEKYKTLDVGIYVVPDITQADLTPFSDGQIIYSQGVFYEVDSTAPLGYKLLNGTGNADENALPYFPTSATAHDVASTIGRVNLFYTGEDDKMLATIHKRNYEPVYLYALSLSENALYIAEVDNEDKTLATLLSEADKYELATKQFVLSHHLSITRNGQELTQEELDYCQKPNATLIDGDGRVYRKISTNEQQNYIEFMAGDIEKDFDISTYVTEIKFPNRILVNTFRGTADYARESVKIWDSTVTKAQLRFLDTDIKNLAKETKKGIADIYNIVADLSIGNTHWVEDESVGLYASLSATTLPKGLINYVGGSSVVINQLISGYAPTDTYAGITFTNEGNGEFIVSGTATSRVSQRLNTTTEDVKTDHKYLICGMEANTQNIGLIFNGYNGSTYVTTYQQKDIGSGAIIDNSNANVNKLSIECVIENGTALSKDYSIKPRVADLTQMFGAGNEPTTTSDPRIQWLIGYLAENPEYNEGEIISAVVTNLKSTDGVNTTNYPIPAEVQALDGYGLGIDDTLFNKTDLENKVFRKVVMEIDLGDLDYSYSSSSRLFQVSISQIKAGTSNLLCSKYTYGVLSGGGDDPDKTIYVYQKTLFISDSAYTDATTFKNAIVGQKLVIEIETPVETDISEYIDRDFPNENLIDLYQGGEVEFENENDMAVPYLLKYEERIN